MNTINVRSAANIAFVKYWGKKGLRLPCNPNLSMTLSQCYTDMEISYKKSDLLSVHVFLDGKRQDSFIPKVKKLIHYFQEEFSLESNCEWTIRSKNSFPHSSGIASSASSMSALSFGLFQLLVPEKFSLERTSYFARLGSGSAARSIYPGYVTWGKFNEQTSDENASELLTIHEDMKEVYDAICIVDSNKKKVSSTKGHELMNSHRFKSVRYDQARENLDLTIQAIKTGDWKILGDVLEEEALTLHGLMMNSRPSFILLHPKTLMIIDKVRSFRLEKGFPLYFTLDAGPNVHLIYGTNGKEVVEKFIKEELSEFCEDDHIIFDKIGFKGTHLK